MKRIVLPVTILFLFVIGTALFPVGQQADRSSEPAVAHPAWTSRHPRVLFDEAHYNAHSVRDRYGPFARLLSPATLT